MTTTQKSTRALLVDKGLKEADMTRVSEQISAYFKQVRALESALPYKVNAYRGRGKERADILVISDMPDEHEQNTGLVGFSDYPLILTMFFNRLGVDFQDVYWTTALKHVHERINLSVIKDELKHLKQEITYIDPAVIIALGTTAITALAGEPIKIEKAVGKEFSYDINPAFDSIPVIPLLHPRTFIELDDDEFKEAIKDTWQNLKIIDALL